MAVLALLLLSLSCNPAAATRGGSYEYYSDCRFSWRERTDACSATCGEGTRSVYREPNIATRGYGSGQACPKPYFLRTEPCTNQNACAEDCKETFENQTSRCSVSCGRGVQSVSTVATVVTPPSGGGEECRGTSSIEQPCDMAPCPGPFAFGDAPAPTPAPFGDGPRPVACEATVEWSWSPCSVSCGEGVRTTTSSLNVTVPPAHGGQECQTPKERTEVCRQQKCPESPLPAKSDIASNVAITAASAPAPTGAYSQAVLAQGGNTLHISGQLGIGAWGQLAEGVEAQTRQALDNMASVLEAAGGDYRHVVKTTVLLQDIRHLHLVDAVYGEVFRTAPPARTMYQVVALPRGALVQVEAVAVLPE